MVDVVIAEIQLQRRLDILASPWPAERRAFDLAFLPQVRVGRLSGLKRHSDH
jgi:hypothetical protein